MQAQRYQIPDLIMIRCPRFLTSRQKGNSGFEKASLYTDVMYEHPTNTPPPSRDIVLRKSSESPACADELQTTIQNAQLAGNMRVAGLYDLGRLSVDAYRILANTSPVRHLIIPSDQKLLSSSHLPSVQALHIFLL